ncbi:MAG: oxidoreductase [Gemmatimonadetes bacterium]|nr:oxidoreductase [Gemmatimonadota bacterium]
MTTNPQGGTPQRIVFAIVGRGWRSEFFLRIARELPERFSIAGLVTRDAEVGRGIEAEWGIPTFRDVASLAAATAPEFVVVSVPRAVAPDVIEHLAQLGLPALTETPPAADVESLLRVHRLTEDGALVQVAEQYHLSPLLRAQLAIASSGRLGTISYALVAQCHDYHGISLIRRALNIGFEDARITASSFDSPLAVGPDRDGQPTEERTVTAHEVSARLDFGDRLGVYDFADEQYFSWIRKNRIVIRGDRGEISDTEVRSLLDFRTPMFSDIRRVDAGEGGNLEGKFLRGITTAGAWEYNNDFIPARLSDDELAIAECLVRMSAYVQGGPSFYSVAEAAQDHYLALLMAEAVRTGETVQSERQGWAS